MGISGVSDARVEGDDVDGEDAGEAVGEFVRGEHPVVGRGRRGSGYCQCCEPGLVEESSTKLPCRRGRRGKRPLCGDVQGGPVNGFDVAIVVLRDEEDFISRLRLGAHDVG